MTTPEMLSLAEIADNAERFASLALALDDAMGSGSSAAGYAGATHILSDLLHDHARQLQDIVKGATEQ